MFTTFLVPRAALIMRSILRREASRTRRAPSKLETVRLLLEDISAGIRVLQTRDGVEVSDEQILERARNIVAGLIGNYRIQSLDASEVREVRAIQQLSLLEQVERGDAAPTSGDVSKRGKVAAKLSKAPARA